MKMIKFLLLLSLFFNIAHASVIAMEDECHHDTVPEYVMEKNISDECGDLCDIDHLFHFIAILSTPNIDFDTSAHNEQPTQDMVFTHSDTCFFNVPDDFIQICSFSIFLSFQK